MFSIGTRIGMAPENSEKQLSFKRRQGSLFGVISNISRERKDSDFATRDARQNTTNDENLNNTQSNAIATEAGYKMEKCGESDTTHSKPTEREHGEEEIPRTEAQEMQSRVDDLCGLRDSVALSVIQRVAKYASDGRNNANAAVVAWRNANTKQLQVKAKTRCARICRELWEQLEKQKKQVTSIRHENTHFMNNLSRDEQGKKIALEQSHQSIMEEEEFQLPDTVDKQAFNSIVEPATFEEEEETKQEFSAAMSMDMDCKESGYTTHLTGEACKHDASIEPSNGSEVAAHEEEDVERFIEVKSPYGSPLTIDTACESSDGEDTLGSADVLTANEVNDLSFSDNICAVQQSTIDFALAIIDCDVVLLDIEVMQSLILVAEKAINGKVFKAPVPRPVLRKKSSSSYVFGSQIATVKARVSVRAVKKMNAIQRAIAKVDKHRQKQRLNITR